MIKKSIIFTILLLICWSLLIKLTPFSLSQHQWQDNIIKAEKFIFDADSVDNLIVGSSLASKLQMDSLPNFYNLSFSGQSLFDGLNILRNKKHLPKNVFIEINVLERGENLNFDQIISSPTLNLLKANLSFFRTDKKPMDKAVDILDKIAQELKEKIIRKPHGNKTKAAIGKQGNLLFDKMLTLQIESYSKTIDVSMMDEHFEVLKKHVDYLESKETKVFFFEMPVNPQLIELNKANYLRDRVRGVFPKNDFITLPKNIGTYKTSDGLHLTKEESEIYTSYFKNEAITVTNGVYK